MHELFSYMWTSMADKVDNSAGVAGWEFISPDNFKMSDGDRHWKINRIK